MGSTIFGRSLHQRRLELGVISKYCAHIVQAFANYRDCFVDIITGYCSRSHEKLTYLSTNGLKPSSMQKYFQKSLISLWVCIMNTASYAFSWAMHLYPDNCVLHSMFSQMFSSCCGLMHLKVRWRSPVTSWVSISRIPSPLLYLTAPFTTMTKDLASRLGIKGEDSFRVIR